MGGIGILTMSCDEVEMGFLGEERGSKGLNLTPDKFLEVVHGSFLRSREVGTLDDSCKVGTWAEWPLRN